MLCNSWSTLCNILYNYPHAQLLLPSGPAKAADSAVAARRGGCQFAGIGFLHLPLHLPLCATRQQFSLLHILGGHRRAAGSAEWPIAQLLPGSARVQLWRKGCKHDSRFTFASEAALSCGSGGTAQNAR